MVFRSEVEKRKKFSSAAGLGTSRISPVQKNRITPGSSIRQNQTLRKSGFLWTGTQSGTKGLLSQPHVVQEYKRTIGETTGLVRHAKIEWQHLVTKGNKKYVDKFKMGTWYTLSEFCEVKGHVAKTPQAMRDFATSLGLEIETDHDIEGVVVLDSTPGMRVQMGVQTSTVKEKKTQQDAASARQTFANASAAMTPDQATMLTEAEIDKRHHNLSAPPTNDSDADPADSISTAIPKGRPRDVKQNSDEQFYMNQRSANTQGACTLHIASRV